jgi:hypothetical protein
MTFERVTAAAAAKKIKRPYGRHFRTGRVRSRREREREKERERERERKASTAGRKRVREGEI